MTAAVEHEAAAERAARDADPQLVEDLAAGDLTELALIDPADLQAGVLAVGLPVAQRPRRSAGGVRGGGGGQLHGVWKRCTPGLARHRGAEDEWNPGPRREPLRRGPRGRPQAERARHAEQAERAAAPAPPPARHRRRGDLALGGGLKLAAEPLQRRLVR